MKWLHFILSHSIFIALCAVALCYQTYLLLHLPSNNDVCAFVFFATLASYNFYWVTGKYSSRRVMNVKDFLYKNISYIFLLVVSGLAVVYFMWELQELWPIIFLAMVLTLLYSSPLWHPVANRMAAKAGFLKTILLSFTWALVTVIIPGYALFYTGFPGYLLILFASRFFFMLLLCLIFDMRDIAIDKMHALHSLATDLTSKALKTVMMLSFFLYFIAGIALRYLQNENAQVIAHIVVGLITWFVYRLSLKKRGYIFYYFLVDGLMMISSLGTILAAI